MSEMDQPPKSWWTPTKVIIVVAIAGIFLLGGILVVAGLFITVIPRGMSVAQQLEDMNDMRQMVAFVVFEKPPGKPPMAADGRLDIYSILEKSVSESRLTSMCTSSRSGKGPQLAEIRARDYSNFPYVRRRGTWNPDRGRDVPIFWDPEPDANNERLVGFSSARTSMVGEDELRVLLEESGQ